MTDDLVRQLAAAIRCGHPLNHFATLAHTQPASAIPTAQSVPVRGTASGARSWRGAYKRVASPATTDAANLAGLLRRESRICLSCAAVKLVFSVERMGAAVEDLGRPGGGRGSMRQR